MPTLHIADAFQLGYVQRAHGIQGEVRAIFITDSPQKYLNLKTLWLHSQNKLAPFTIQTLKWLKDNEFILSLLGVEDRNQAESISGVAIYLPVTQLPELSSDTQFYYHEIIGFQVQDKNQGLIGTVDSVIEMPGQDLLVVRQGAKEVMIPITDEFVPKINRSDAILFTNLPDGLLDVYSA